jgi:hypothetical protein
MTQKLPASNAGSKISTGYIAADPVKKCAIDSAMVSAIPKNRVAAERTSDGYHDTS